VAGCVSLLPRHQPGGAAGAALRERLEGAGVDPGAPSTPDGTRAFLEAELAKFRDIVARAGLRLSRG
jgi:hypothetical protein